MKKKRTSNRTTVKLLQQSRRLGELQRALRKQKPRKSSGPDGITDEMLIHLGSAAVCKLLRIFSHLQPSSTKVCLSQQQASVSQGRICSDNFTCCHTETEVADQTFYLTQSQYTDTGSTSPSSDPITPGAWQGSHWSANFEVTGMTRPRKNPCGSGIRTRDLPLSRRTP